MKKSKLQPGDILWRAHATVTSLGVSIHYESWSIERQTSHGLWLVDSWFARKTWRKFPGRFAFLTKEEALENLKRRSVLRFKHAHRRLEDARDVLKVLKLEEPLISFCRYYY